MCELTEEQHSQNTAERSHQQYVGYYIVVVSIVDFYYSTATHV